MSDTDTMTGDPVVNDNNHVDEDMSPPSAPPTWHRAPPGTPASDTETLARPPSHIDLTRSLLAQTSNNHVSLASPSINVQDIDATDTDMSQASDTSEDTFDWSQEHDFQQLQDELTQAEEAHLHDLVVVRDLLHEQQNFSGWPAQESEALTYLDSRIDGLLGRAHGDCRTHHGSNEGRAACTPCTRSPLHGHAINEAGLLTPPPTELPAMFPGPSTAPSFSPSPDFMRPSRVDLLGGKADEPWDPWQFQPAVDGPWCLYPPEREEGMAGGVPYPHADHQLPMPRHAMAERKVLLLTPRVPTFGGYAADLERQLRSASAEI